MEQVYVNMEQTVKRKGTGSENPSSENSAGHRAVLILSDDDIQDFVRKEKENMQKIGMLLDNMMDQINNVPEYVPVLSDVSFDIGKYV